jgi:hypothetical protein
LGVKSTPYAKEVVELQDSNMTPDQTYTINSKSWQKVRQKVRKEEHTKLTSKLQGLYIRSFVIFHLNCLLKSNRCALIVALTLVTSGSITTGSSSPPGSSGGASAAIF